jgi:hypothetical protein
MLIKPKFGLLKNKVVGIHDPIALKHKYEWIEEDYLIVPVTTPDIKIFKDLKTDKALILALKPGHIKKIIEHPFIREQYTLAFQGVFYNSKINWYLVYNTAGICRHKIFFYNVIDLYNHLKGIKVGSSTSD